MANQSAVHFNNAAGLLAHSGTAGTAETVKVVADTGGALTVGKQWSSSAGTVTIPTSDTVTSGTTANTFTGYARGITIVTPAMTATGTATLKLIDSKGGTTISQAQAESVTAFYGTTSPMTTDMNWICTANGTQNAAATISFLVHYEK